MHELCTIWFFTLPDHAWSCIDMKIEKYWIMHGHAWSLTIHYHAWLMHYNSKSAWSCMIHALTKFSMFLIPLHDLTLTMHESGIWTCYNVLIMNESFDKTEKYVAHCAWTMQYLVFYFAWSCMIMHWHENWKILDNAWPCMITNGQCIIMHYHSLSLIIMHDCVVFFMLFSILSNLVQHTHAHKIAF